jgi:hypothetical protein
MDLCNLPGSTGAVGDYVGPSLRSEFVTFSKLPKIDAANRTGTATKSSKIQKKSQTLRMTAQIWARKI